MNTAVRVRFAPSPTGPLHMGGVRTALYNYLFAKKMGGQFILRVEDTDQTRLIEGAEDYLRKSLEWAGITPDEGQGYGGEYGPYLQSNRKEIYKEYIDKLIADDKAYLAFDTAEDLERVREQAKKSGFAGWQYNYITRMSMKNSLTLSEEEVKKRVANAEKYVVRAKLPINEEIKFEDIIRGTVSVNTNHMDDKVLWKGDGLPTYHLANVVDDHLMKISHIIRGEEWLPSAPIHIFLYRAFGWKPPLMAHLPLILKPNGNGKLSKRDGDKLGFPVFPLQWTDPQTGNISEGYKEQGYLPEAFVNMLSLLGWNPGDNRELFSLEKLIEIFELERVNKSGARFDPQKTLWFNHKHLSSLKDDELLSLVTPLFAEAKFECSSEKILTIAKLLLERINLIPEFVEQARFFFESKDYDWSVIQKKVQTESQKHLSNLVSKIEDNLPKKASEFKTQFEAILNDFELKFGKLGPVVRYATTYSIAGPSLFEIFEILGREQVVIRLKKFLKFLEQNG